MSYVPVRLGTIRANQEIGFDIYVGLKEKYIHYAHKGDPVDGERLLGLKNKKVKKLYIKEADESLYLQYLDAGLDSLSSADVSMEQKAETVHSSMVTEAENAERSLGNEHSYQAMQGRVKKVVEFVSSEKGALQSILDAAGCSLDNFHHSSNVSTMVVSLAVKCGLKNPEDLFELSLAALLHDIGKTKLNISYDAIRENLSKEELIKYRTHPKVGVDMLSSKPYVTPPVLRLILEHEEAGEGEGFPEKKILSKLPLDTQLLCLCNEFDRMSAQKKVVPAQMVADFFQEKAALYDTEHITLLGEILQGK